MSGRDDWYSMEHLPRGKLHIRVRRESWLVEAATEVDKRGVRHWHEVVGRELRPLPWQPVAWQPRDALTWRWPNGAEPPPVLPVLVEPQMASIGGMAFDAALAAEEMEADRGAARTRRHDEPADDGGQWWRDVARVAYEACGGVTRDMGEARVMRALILERTIRMDMARYKSNAAVLAAMKLTLADVLADEPEADWVPPLVPQPEDWRDFDTVMGWLAEVGTTKRELTVMRARMHAPPLAYSQIADALGIKRQRARQIYVSAIDDLVEAANRPPRRAMARIAALRLRNKAARRGA